MVKSGMCIWAKTDMKEPSSLLWLSLRQHLLDTMGISHYIFTRYLSSHTRDILNACFHGYAEQVLAFLSGVHDIGKCTPAFEKQVMDSGYDFLIDNLDEHGLDIPPHVESKRLRHETSGFYAVRHWLMNHGFSKDYANTLSIAVGGHHGTYHDAQVYASVPRKRNEYGDMAWDNERTSIMDEMSSISGFDMIRAILSSDEHTITMPVQSILTGCIVMSDWISSSTWTFPLLPTGTYAGEEQVRIDEGWRRAKLDSSWDVSRPDNTEDMLHHEFDVPDEAEPNAMQMAAVDIARESHSPSMMIIEAPMGSGKTEAALMCAHHLAYNNGYGGVAFSLPTQATANGILPRVMKWIPKTTGGRESVELVHGRSALNEDFSQLRGTSLYDDVGIEVNRWFDGSRRGVLANFVVCTIDQVLMLALQSKHFDLRHLGFANKVVIIDEVHAADDYMMIYLNRALEWLAALGSSVILLSATLPSERRAAMIRSFSYGLDSTYDDNADVAMDSYPLITSVSHDGVVYKSVEKGCDDASTLMHIEHIDDDEVIANLRESLRNGGCACVIRNTVGGAQTLYEDVIAAGIVGPDEVMVVHSRFNGHDRSIWERSLLKRFGKDTSMRPHRFIVIGTQVLEQSLDLDFDIMITDIVPMDLLLQRAGRCHRHHSVDEVRPRNLMNPKILVTGYRYHDGTVSFDSGSLYVYGFGKHRNMSKLLRTVALMEHRDTISLPDDIHPMVEEAYDMNNVPPSDYASMIHDEDEKLCDIISSQEQRASIGVLRRPRGYTYNNTGKTRSDMLWGSNESEFGGSSEDIIMASVRDIHSSLGVIMIVSEQEDSMRFVSPDMDGRYGMVSLLSTPDGTMSKDISSQSIQLPSALSGEWIIRETIDILERDMIPSWQRSPLLKGELVLRLDNMMHTVITCKHKDFEITYSGITGLHVEERK